MELGGVDMIEFREVKSGDLVNYLDVKSEEEAQVKADSIFLASADHLLKWRILEGARALFYSTLYVLSPEQCPTYCRYFNE